MITTSEKQRIWYDYGTKRTDQNQPSPFTIPMFPTLPLGPAVLPTAAIAYLLGFWLALTAVERAAKRLKHDVAPIYNLATVGLVAAIIGARLTFVLIHWDSYQNNLIGIVWPLNSGFSAPGGLLIGVIAMVFYGRAKQLPLWSTLDALAPGLIVLLMTVSLADFLGGPGLGATTDLPIGLDVFGTRRHAVQLYEVLVGGLALWVWWRVTSAALSTNSAESRFAGRPFLTTFVVYTTGRLFADSLRANSALIEGYHTVQLVSLTLSIILLILLARKTVANNPTTG
jgi:phosphatidylglycerol:prolipoprotein diacylglycerol transferase